MKLPTLNIDVALNTQTLRKDVAKANAEILKVGRGALAAGGPMGGRAGQLAGAAGALFGTGAGAGVVMAGGAALAAAAPVKTAMAIVDAFAESAERGRKALDSFAEGKGTADLELTLADQMERPNLSATDRQEITVLRTQLRDWRLQGVRFERRSIVVATGVPRRRKSPSTTASR